MAFYQLISIIRLLQPRGIIDSEDVTSDRMVEI